MQYSANLTPENRSETPQQRLCMPASRWHLWNWKFPPEWNHVSLLHLYLQNTEQLDISTHWVLLTQGWTLQGLTHLVKTYQLSIMVHSFSPCWVSSAQGYPYMKKVRDWMIVEWNNQNTNFQVFCKHWEKNFPSIYASTLSNFYVSILRWPKLQAYARAHTVLSWVCSLEAANTHWCGGHHVEVAFWVFAFFSLCSPSTCSDLSVLLYLGMWNLLYVKINNQNYQHVKQEISITKKVSLCADKIRKWSYFQLLFWQVMLCNPGSLGAHCVGVEHTEICLSLPLKSWDVEVKSLHQHTLLKFTIF